ncbi:facilitated trehalose transporter Tret1-like [Dermacentor silvarum]|uniref:facilitated trehalose transporter Tret1-like n=1 Tax=Dermacentor silvarum TaxID=543639 RepID=UPI00210098D4|nr:facilitated trehalose transporter Tret1-like [Dermacentor silvarum]
MTLPRTPSDPSMVASAHEQPQPQPQLQPQSQPQSQPPQQPQQQKPAPGSPGNAAMEALRRWRPAVKGATPTVAPDDPAAGGRHERAMMVALLVNMSAGMALGYASVSMPRIELEIWYSLQRNVPHKEWVANVLLLGAAAGALLSGLLLHLLGPRRTLLLSAFGLINAWICVVVSNSFTMLMIGRVTCGIWLGVSTNSVSLYVCDVAPPAKRTFYGALTEVAVSLGMLAAYVLGGLAWQMSAIVFTLAPVPVFLLHNYVIESPRWFVTKGRYRDSNTAMVRLYGDDVPTDFRFSRTGEDSNISTVGRQKVARMLSVCLLLNLLQSLSCAQLVLLHAVQVVGPLVDVMAPQEAACLVLATHVSCATLFAALTRFIGRRQLLIVSAVLVAGVLSTMRPFDYVVFSRWSPSPATATRWDALCSVCLLVLTYSIGLCHVPPLVISELLPLKGWRYLSASFVWVWRWLVAFVMVHFDQELLGAGDFKSLSLAFGLALLLVAAAAVPFVPETEGRTLADIHRDE